MWILPLRSPLTSARYDRRPPRGMAGMVRVEVRLSLPFGKAYDCAEVARPDVASREDLTRRERDVLSALCRPLLKQAHQLWLEGEVPYEAARARELLAESLLQSGKADA